MSESNTVTREQTEQWLLDILEHRARLGSGIDTYEQERLARAHLELLAQNQRLHDLVRYKRSELLSDDLISMDEYAELAQDHAAVARLESYDGALAKIRSQVALLESQLAEARKHLSAEQVLAQMDKYCERIGNQKLAAVLRSDFLKTGKMAPAILASLELKPVVMYEALESARNAGALRAKPEAI